MYIDMGVGGGEVESIDQDGRLGVNSEWREGLGRESVGRRLRFGFCLGTERVNQ